jgi:hypothetical protein
MSRKIFDFSNFEGLRASTLGNGPRAYGSSCPLNFFHEPFEGGEAFFGRQSGQIVRGGEEGRGLYQKGERQARFVVLQQQAARARVHRAPPIFRNSCPARRQQTTSSQIARKLRFKCVRVAVGSGRSPKTQKTPSGGQRAFAYGPLESHYFSSIKTTVST